MRYKWTNIRAFWSFGPSFLEGSSFAGVRTVENWLMGRGRKERMGKKREPDPPMIRFPRVTWPDSRWPIPMIFIDFSEEFHPTTTCTLHPDLHSSISTQIPFDLTPDSWKMKLVGFVGVTATIHRFCSYHRRTPPLFNFLWGMDQSPNKFRDGGAAEKTNQVTLISKVSKWSREISGISRLNWT